MDRKIELTDEQIEKARRILDPYCCIGGQTTDMAFILRLAAVLSESVTLTDDKCCIGPPDKDGRKCTADWLETDESDELHVIEYRLHRPAVPAPAQEPVAPMDDKCPKCGYTTRITMNSDYSPLRARLSEQPTELRKEPPHAS
jgi:rRNA maturation protein Nop10